ncbi:MAG: peptide chain release factor N(5)-glutamine methyltransferase [Lentisphaeria bacterium]
MLYSTILHFIEEKLANGNIENNNQEARWLLEYAKKQNPGYPPENLMIFLIPLLKRRISGEPLQYILGSVMFYELELEIGPGVLIPRPETELLIDLALKKYPGNGNILDLCTGSGAILLNLARLLPKANHVGIDISPHALHWAEINQKKHNLDNVYLFCGDLFNPLENTPYKFSVVTANPPYISSEDYYNLPHTIKDFEPKSALLAMNKGLAITERIIEGAQNYLETKGWLILEIGNLQGAQTQEKMKENNYQNISCIKDYTHQDRFVLGQKI